MSHILFTGNFRDLIPLGFRFEKKFARNYRCYTTYNPEDVRNSPPHPLWIYQKGRSVEIDDWGDSEVPILKYLEGKTFKHDIASFCASKKTGEVIESCNCDLNTTRLAIRHLQGELTVEEYDKLVDEYYATYHEINVDVIALYKELDRIKWMYQIVEGD